MKICIFGAGAIGGYLAAGLHAVEEVELSLVARGAHLAAIRERGLTLLIGEAQRVCRPRATDNPAELGPQDYVIVCLKAHQAWEATAQMLPLFDEATAVVTGQNGVPWWYAYGLDGSVRALRLRSVDPGTRQWATIGPQRAIGCVVYPAAEIASPGVVRHSYGSKFPLGEPDGSVSERCRRLSRVFEAAGFAAPILQDIRNELWLKLWGNLCFNPLSALTRATLDVVTTQTDLRALCIRMMTEAKAVATAFGVSFRVDCEKRLRGAARVGAHRTSMLQDLERGRQLELDALLASVQEMGRFAGIETPYIDVVLALTQQLGRSLRVYPAFPDMATNAGGTVADGTLRTAARTKAAELQAPGT